MSTSISVQALKQNIAARRDAANTRFTEAMDRFEHTMAGNATVHASTLPGHAHPDSVKALLAKLGIRPHEDTAVTRYPRFAVADANINAITLHPSGATQKEAAQLTG